MCWTRRRTGFRHTGAWWFTYREAHLAMEKIAESGQMRSLEVVEVNTCARCE
jgi:arginase family enzyme